jgi:hypothetical protein
MAMGITHRGMARHPRPHGEKNSPPPSPRTLIGKFSPIPVLVREFIPVGNLSLLRNTIIRCKFKLIISNNTK